jgi:predicted ArsR family transcriptional regulator
LGEVFTAEPAPEGYLTRREWAEVWQVSQSQAKRHLTKIIAAGKMEMRWCRQTDVGGRPYRVPIYGIIKKEK